MPQFRRIAGRPGTRWTVAVVLVVGVLAASTARAACGDATLDPGESCDDGNPTAGDCCDAACAPEPAGSACADDADLCTDDVCDGAGQCAHPANQAPCDDGDPCTLDDACADGACAGRPAPEQCIDTAVCYAAREGTHEPDVTVGLDDAFGTRFVDLAQPREVCAPAGADGMPRVDPTTWLEAYRLDPRLRSNRNVTLVDRFGTHHGLLGLLDRALLATATSPSGPPVAPPTPGTVNHYACRRYRFDERFTGRPTVAVTDDLGSRSMVVHRPARLCSPVDVDEPGSGIVHPDAHLMCYDVLTPGSSHVPQLELHTANLRGAGELTLYPPGQLCVPALVIPPAKPCLTTGDECGLPCCKRYGGQNPDCAYDPVVPAARYPTCEGPLVLVDRTHRNFHEVTPESQLYPGRFWGFAKLLVRDGYVVRDSTVPFAQLLPTTTARILVIANPRAFSDDPAADAVSPADAALVVDWVAGGGSLLLSIDHRPYERAGALLSALGLVRLFDGAMATYTFTRAAGDLNGAAAIANGDGPATTVDEVTTFTGTAFSIAPVTPPGAVYEPVLVLPPGTIAISGGFPVDASGLLQGVAIQFGAGRVYVSGESGGLTAQRGFGMQETPDNEQFLRNAIHWLDQ